MKKIFILVAIALLTAGSVAVADESVIIDFTLLTADILEGPNGQMTQNRHTLMDYSHSAGDTFSTDQKALMKTSLSFNNWQVVLNTSARSPASLTMSQVVAAPVRAEAKVPFAGKNVLGVRVVFPTTPNNANARVEPSFTLPGFEPMRQVDENGTIQDPTPEDKATGFTRFENGYGVVKNVGSIRSLAVSTLGSNFPHSVYLILSDADDVERRYYMGTLNFDGWKEMIWVNPNYLSDVRTRELRLVPLYPVSVPYLKFAALYITRDAMEIGGDFIAYFKDVKVIYDKAVMTTERDIVDEDLWGIFATREAAKQNLEMSRFGTRQVEVFLEQEKRASEAPFTQYIQDDTAAAGQAPAQPAQ